MAITFYCKSAISMPNLNMDGKDLAAYVPNVVAKSGFPIEKEEVNQYDFFLYSNLTSIVYTTALEYEAMKKE